ncbi:MAG: hypothetical protein AAB337_02840, partial [Patescibacteria group bacterium]
EVVTTAARLAPFEAHKNRQWITVKLGVLATGRDFMKNDYGWGNYPEQYIKEFEPLGAPHMNAVYQAIDEGYQSGCDSEQAGMSTCSREIVRRIQNLPTDLSQAYAAGELAAVLMHLPDGAIVRSIFERMEMLLEMHSPALIYRWALSVSSWFDRDAYRILGGGQVRDLDERRWCEAAIRESWFFSAIKQWMKAKGWRGLEVYKRRNERYEERSSKGWDFEVSYDGRDGRTHIFKLWRGLTMREDSYNEGQIVLLPPNAETVTRIVYQNDSVVIHEAGELFHPDKPVTSKMRPYMCPV